MMRYMIGSATIYLLCMVTYSVSWITVIDMTNGTCNQSNHSSRLCGNQTEIIDDSQTLELRCPYGTQYHVIAKVSSNETLDKSRCESGECPQHNKGTSDLSTICNGSTQASCNETVQISRQAHWSQNETHFAEIFYECLADSMTSVTPTPGTSSVTPSASTAYSTRGNNGTNVTETPGSTGTATLTTATVPTTTPDSITTTTTTVTSANLTVTATTAVTSATSLPVVDSTKQAPPPAPPTVTEPNFTTMTTIVTESSSPAGKPGETEIYIIIVGAVVLVAVAIVAAVIISRRRKRKRKALTPNIDLVIKAVGAKGQTLGDDNQRHSSSGYTEIDLDDNADDTRMPPPVISDVSDCACKVTSDGAKEKAEMKETGIDAHREEEKSKQSSNGHTIILLRDGQTVEKEEKENGKVDEEIRRDAQTEERKVQHKLGDDHFAEREHIYANGDDETAPYVNQNGTKQTGLENGQIYPVGTNPNQNPYHSLERLPQEDITDTADVVFLRGGQRRPFLSSSDTSNDAPLVGGLTAPNDHEIKVRSSAGSNFSSSDRESDHYYSEIKDSIFVDEDDYTVPDEAASRRGASRRISEGDYEAVDFEYDEEVGDHTTTMYKAANKDGRGVAATKDEAFDDSDEVLIIENDTYESSAAIDDDKDRGDDRGVADTQIPHSLDPHPESIVTCSASCSPSGQTVPDKKGGDGREKNDDDSDEEGFMFDNDIYIPFNT